MPSRNRAASRLPLLPCTGCSPRRIAVEVLSGPAQNTAGRPPSAARAATRSPRAAALISPKERYRLLLPLPLAPHTRVRHPSGRVSCWRER